ncbi:MAG: hypothetical protein AB7C91_05755 [Sphaerochaeta sp.]|uniref:hypothetical protein n=1 Tax=Sphaerochaeta sp. TaxID=1972642 RepID=UPI003D0FF6DD
MKSKRSVILLVTVSLFLLTSCFATVVENSDHPAGFLLGIWHGWIAPIALIGRLFDPTIRIYEVNNTGWWYEFGFYIAIISGFGTISLVRKNTGGGRR